MSSLYVDKFERDNNTDLNIDTPMGGSYTEVTEAFEIVSGKLKAINLNPHLATCDSPTINNADYYVQAVVFTQTDFASGVGVVLRYIDSSNYYYARINTFGQTLQIRKKIAGVDSQVGSTYDGGYVQNTSYTLKLSATGTTLKAYVNGVERISTTDSDLTLPGKAGFWSDYGNSTWDNFCIVGDITKEAIPAIGTDYTQPILPSTPYGWKINGIDYQIVTKSDGWNQDQTKRLNEYEAGKTLCGANYAAIAVPYNNIAKYRNYVADARTKGLKIWHRSHWDGWQADNSIPAELSSQDYLEDTYRFITENPTLFEDEDCFTFCVEANNADGENNSAPFRTTGSFDMTKYNQFLKDQVKYANAAFAAINKSVQTNLLSVTLSLTDLAGQTLDSGDGGNSSGFNNAMAVEFWNGLITIDHYLSDSYRYTTSPTYWSRFSSDLDKIHTAFPDCKIMIGEWGYHTTTAVSDAERAAMYAQIIEVLRSKSYIYGVCFWNHMGQTSSSIFTDSSGTLVTAGRTTPKEITQAFTLGNRAYGMRIRVT